MGWKIVDQRCCIIYPREHVIDCLSHFSFRDCGPLWKTPCMQNREVTGVWLDSDEYLSRYCFYSLVSFVTSGGGFKLSVWFDHLTRLSEKWHYNTTLASREEIVWGFDSPNINYVLFVSLISYHTSQPCENTICYGADMSCFVDRVKT